MRSKLLILLILTILLAGGLFFIIRGGFIEEILFSNKKYAENIEMETYVISEEKLTEIFANHWEQPLVQQSRRELLGKEAYLVIRVTNRGNNSAWGTLWCQVDRSNLAVQIYAVPFKRWFSYVIPRGEFTTSQRAGRGEFPEIIVKWKRLYTK